MDGRQWEPASCFLLLKGEVRDKRKEKARIPQGVIDERHQYELDTASFTYNYLQISVYTRLTMHTHTSTLCRLRRPRNKCTPGAPAWFSTPFSSEKNQGTLEKWLSLGLG